MSTIGSTINNRVTITNGVTVGTGNYASPLTITQSGYVSYGGPAYAITGTGVLVNQGTVTQGGDGNGAVSLTGASSVSNSGTITGVAGYVIDLNGSGGISNAGSGLIGGFLGVKLTGTGDMLTNLGSIAAGAAYGNAAYLADGGTVTNGQAVAGASTASLQGADGVSFGGAAAGTVVNYGTIVGIK